MNGTFPFPDVNTITMNDLIGWMSCLFCLKVIYICIEDILEWFGIPCTSNDKYEYYDRLIRRRSFVSKASIAISTPFLFANLLCFITTLLGQGPIGGYALWMFLLRLYQARCERYENTNCSEYVMFNSLVFSLALIQWVPGETFLNLYWCICNCMITILLRVCISYLSSSSPEITLVSLTQHCQWDLLESYQFLNRHVIKLVQYMNEHEYVFW